MRDIVLASNNAHKASEIEAMLGRDDVRVRTLADCGLASDPVEDADTFWGNARIKARAAQALAPGVAVLADDSGLEVDALDGAPGVWSARFAGEDATDAANNAKLFAELADVPEGKRQARFVCELVFLDETGEETHVRGTIEGVIGFEERGDGGFGYDPLFYPDAYGHERSLAEATAEEKNAISHRGCAVRALKEALA
ncbi:RdgB/HAM1 family non-canonical purine NTP pyrophosphatase [Eggerthellaceae bacterium zg-893]|nr:RdgB/HAM1 family non-canonical purine NTP pyrophosphatase [Eggerthellaceae bacterium zg-893]